MTHEYNEKKHRRLLVIVAIIAALVFGYVIFAQNDASADEPTPTCVPSPAIPATPGTPEIPAVTQEVVVPGTPDLWWNWSPNDTKGPQDYEPGFPVDNVGNGEPRGTWQGPHENGGPDQDTYGTFNSSNGNSGNSSWFHRDHGTPETTTTVVITPAVPAVPGTPAVPAVTCPEPPSDEPTTPTETPTVPTETPSSPTPTVPTDEPTTDVETPVATPEDDDEVVIICGIVIEPVKAGQPVPRDILCPLPPSDEKDPVVKTETDSSVTKSVKTYTQESGKVTKIVKHYGAAEDLVEEGL